MNVHSALMVGTVADLLFFTPTSLLPHRRGRIIGWIFTDPI
jgi:hypothetical protein